MGKDLEKKDNAGINPVEVLGATYEKGMPHGEEMGKWRHKLYTRDDKLKYLQTGERYFYSQDWFGSEKRKSPA